MNNWIDAIVVRHKDIHKIVKMAENFSGPVINALTNVNHPCEMMSDVYALSKIRKDFKADKFLFCGTNSNIGLAWKEASEAFGFELTQCCPKGYEISGVQVLYDLRAAVQGKDVICADSLSADELPAFKEYQITSDIMRLANKGAILNPCPPFYRGEEVSDEVIESDYFVGYEFKKHLLEVQQAILLYCLGKLE